MKMQYNTAERINKMKKIFDIFLTQNEDILIEKTCVGDILLSKTGKGHFEGENIRGEVIPIGMGITSTSNPGQNNISSNMLLKVDDGSKILMKIEAIFDIDHKKEKLLENGQYICPDEYYYKGVTSFYTDSTSFSWLERKIFICTFEIKDWSTLEIQVYMI